MIFNKFDNGSFDDFSLGLSVSSPEEHKENVLHMNLLNDDNALYLQTPRLNYNYSNRPIIQFKGKTQSKVNEFYSFIQSLESYVSQLVSEQLKTLSSDIITSQLFKSSISIPKTLQDPLSLNTVTTNENKPDFEVYNRKGQKIEFQQMIDSQHDHFCTFIIVAQYISVTPTCAQIQWKIVQALLHPPKKKKKVKEFGIQDLNETVKKPVLHFKQLGIVPADPVTNIKDEPVGSVGEGDGKENNDAPVEEDGITIEL